MKVADLLESRRENWRRLERLCLEIENRRGRLDSAALVRFGSLYRAACADLALADAYQLPPNTVQFLHQLVGRAHNQLYRSRAFNFAAWGREMLYGVPRRLFHDNCLRLAFAIFWGVFLLAMFLAYVSTDFAEQVIGEESISMLEESFSDPIQGRDPNASGAMAGFYIFNNAGIGLRCFAFGLLFGVGGMFVTVFNAAFLGAVFGYMARAPQKDNFFHFVTAHGPFELTAIVLSAAAGMRLGFALVDTRGLARTESLRRAAQEAVPIMGAAVILFCLAAGLEAFLSPSAAPYWVKAAAAIGSSGMLMFYFIMLGYPRGDSLAAR
jgi:uncharacterized membrane protein SpoIIM required for sporulation